MKKLLWLLLPFGGLILAAVVVWRIMSKNTLPKADGNTPLERDMFNAWEKAKLLWGVKPTRAPWEYAAVQAANAAGIQPAQLLAHVAIESSWIPSSVRVERRPDGSAWAASVGFGQILWPGTALQYLPIVGAPSTMDAAFEPAVNLRMAARLLAALNKSFGGNLRHAASAYNMGAGNTHKDLNAGVALRNQAYVDSWERNFIKEGGRF